MRATLVGPYFGYKYSQRVKASIISLLADDIRNTLARFSELGLHSEPRKH
jgi:biotin transporter BioY